jgi:membrane-associated phospholipid phosphatase
MMPLETESAPPRPLEVERRWILIRRIGLLGYFGLLAVQYFVGLPLMGKGIPFAGGKQIAWLFLGSAIWSLGRDRREIIYGIVGWGALAIGLKLFAVSRNAVDDFWGSPTAVPGYVLDVPEQSITNARWVIPIDRLIGFGKLPTERLQSALYSGNNDNPPYWEVIPALVYLSHFVVVYVIAIVQWIRNRIAWLRWVAALSTLLITGVILYMLVPLAPPWITSPLNLMGPIERVGPRGIQYTHLTFTVEVWERGVTNTNNVAAFPSLHYGFTALIAIFFWKQARIWLRVVLATYSGLMLFTLVYGGEHYVFDCLAGGVLAWLVVAGNRAIEGWWGERQLLKRNDSSSLVDSSDKPLSNSG